MYPTTTLTWEEKKVLVALALERNPYDFDADPAVLRALHEKGLLERKVFYKLNERGRKVVAS